MRSGGVKERSVDLQSPIAGPSHGQDYDSWRLVDQEMLDMLDDDDDDGIYENENKDDEESDLEDLIGNEDGWVDDREDNLNERLEVNVGDDILETDEEDNVEDITHRNEGDFGHPNSRRRRKKNIVNSVLASLDEENYDLNLPKITKKSFIGILENKKPPQKNIECMWVNQKPRPNVGRQVRTLIKSVV